MFAALADRVGTRELPLDLSEGATVGAALEAVESRLPALSELADRIATAVNLAYVRRDHRLADGDELALIPPVSGG
jgi:molybdopterin synthase catalytic subunit